jgi:zinc/manganese transport system substrate-binding protein
MRTILVAVAAMLALAGCGSSRSGAVDVVASTNVYGDLARQLGGPHVAVTSVLSDPNADPHLFEPTIRDGLEVAKADVLIENGAGYDTFMDDLAGAAPSDSRVTVDAADVLGVGDGNPHVWYDLPRVPKIARAITGAFVRVDAPHAADYRSRLRRFTSSLGAFARVGVPPNRPVAYTEPVPEYLVEALHLRNLAPTAFTRAIENGTEPSPKAVAEMEALLRERRVDALLYNSQAVSPITQRLRSLADAHGVAVVPVTETLPRGLTYQQWQLRQLRALREALQ